MVSNQNISIYKVNFMFNKVSLHIWEVPFSKGVISPGSMFKSRMQFLSCVRCEH